MPWTVDNPPNVAKNWTDEEKAKCVAAGNAVLADGGTDEEAIFACIHAAGREATVTDEEKRDEETAKKICDVKTTKQAASVPYYLRAYVEKTQATTDDAPVRFVATTEGVKRDGLDLKAGDWSLDNFLRHPVVLWAHDYTSRLPLGTAAPTWDGNRLLMDVSFDGGDEFAQEVKRKARLGMVAASVGWNDLAEGKRDLMELSIVPVPADPDALPVRARQAWEAYERETNGVGVGAVRVASLPGSAADNVSITATAVPDQEVSVTDKRYGVVISRRNLEDLERAVELIQAVVARAKKEEATDGEQAEGERGSEITLLLTEIQNRLNKLTEVKQ